MTAKVEKRTLTGSHAVSMAWVIADRRSTRSTSARFFSALNDDRYEVTLDGKVITANDVTAEMTDITHSDEPGGVYLIENILTGLTVAGVKVPLSGGAMISNRGGVPRLGKLPVTATYKQAA